MGDTITLTSEQQRRGRILAHLSDGDLEIEQAAAWLGVSVRHAWRLRARLLAEGPAALEVGLDAGLVVMHGHPVGMARAVGHGDVGVEASPEVDDHEEHGEHDWHHHDELRKSCTTLMLAVG